MLGFKTKFRFIPDNRDTKSCTNISKTYFKHQHEKVMKAEELPAQFRLGKGFPPSAVVEHLT